MTAPRHVRRTVLATPSVVGLLRDLTESCLLAWDLKDRVDDTCLVVSELVTNALRVASGTAIVLDLWAPVDGRGLNVELWDRSSVRPVPRTPEPDDESGRGLLIVAALAADWGVRHLPAGGKVVWARMG